MKVRLATAPRNSSGLWDASKPKFIGTLPLRPSAECSKAFGIWDISRRLQFSPGLRLDAYFSGPNAALAVEPRLNLRVQLSPDFAINNAFGLADQTPAFVVPVPGLQPTLEGGLQRTAQSSAGVEWSLPAGFRSSASLFHRLFFNVTDQTAITRFNETVDNPRISPLARLQGRSVGMSRPSHW